MILPRTCSCGSSMEWHANGHWDAKRASWRGVYLCAHCDRGCTRAEAACHACQRMKVKR